MFKINPWQQIGVWRTNPNLKCYINECNIFLIDLSDLSIVDGRQGRRFNSIQFKLKNCICLQGSFKKMHDLKMFKHICIYKYVVEKLCVQCTKKDYFDSTSAICSDNKIKSIYHPPWNHCVCV